MLQSHVGIRKLASVSGRSDYQMLVTTLLRGGAYSPATDEFLSVLSCNNATCKYVYPTRSLQSNLCRNT